MRFGVWQGRLALSLVLELLLFRGAYVPLRRRFLCSAACRFWRVESMRMGKKKPPSRRGRLLCRFVRYGGSGQLLDFDLFEDVALEISWAAEEPHFGLSHLNPVQ